MAYKLSLGNYLDRPVRLRLEPYLFADIGPEFQHHDYDMPPSARWSILGPNPDVELELHISVDVITVLVTGCQVDEITVADSTSGEVQTVADGPPARWT